MPRESRERFTLTIQDVGSPRDVPLMPRLRRLLKAMLRGYGIRCCDIRPHGNKETRPGRLANGIERNQSE